MKANRPSVTAQATTLVRALESCRPADDRLLDDRFACGMLDWTNRSLLRLFRAPAIGSAATTLLDRLMPGTRDSVTARTLHIDSELCAALDTDVAQVVILGAGFDCRSLRIRGIDRVCVFEVDHPATQARKRSCLAQMLLNEPAHLHFVAIDFIETDFIETNCGLRLDDHPLERDRLGEAMVTAGFRADARSFFIWEGVTEYLSAEGVDRTLRFVSTAAPGSTIAFTYKDVSGLRGAGARSPMRRARLVGEPWIFGLDPSEISTFLAARGLVLIEDVAASEREARHLPASRRPCHKSDLDRTVLAEVPGDVGKRAG